MDFRTFTEILKQVVFPSDLDRLPLEEILRGIRRVDKLTIIPSGSPVLVRTDLDMPVSPEGAVEDFSRIEACGPTIRYCVGQGWKIILFGHLGRDNRLSVLPVCKAMSDYLGVDIKLVEDWLDQPSERLNDEFVATISNAKPGSVFMLQNTRKYRIEQMLWDAKPDELTDVAEHAYAICEDIRQRLTQIHINEAIAASNKDFSSVAVPLLMAQSALGFYIDEEFRVHIQGVRRADFVIFSGLKINKLDDLENIVGRGKVKLIIAAGSLAMALLKARNQLEGRSFSLGRAEEEPSYKAYIEPKRVVQAKRIVEVCSQTGVQLILPVDFVLDDCEVVRAIPPGNAQMDIGPETRSLFARTVRAYVAEAKKAGQHAVFLNGVFGKFEDPRFTAGTREFIPLLREITQNGIPTYVGGGEGRLALLKYGSISDVTHAFTCGGTVLKSLGETHVPFLKALYLQNTKRGESRESRRESESIA